MTALRGLVVQLEELVEMRDFEHLAHFLRRIVQVHLNSQLFQRREQSQHAAGDVLNARQIERQLFATVHLEQRHNLFAAFDHVEMVGKHRPAESDDGSGTGLVNSQNLMMNRHGDNSSRLFLFRTATWKTLYKTQNNRIGSTVSQRRYNLYTTHAATKIKTFRLEGQDQDKPQVPGQSS